MLNIKDSDYEQIELPTKKQKVKKANYNLSNSPLKFKSYLTMYYDAEKPMHFQSEFYVSGLIKSSAITPSTLPHDMTDKGNIFYYEKTNSTGWYIVGGAAAAGLLIYSAVAFDEVR